MDDHLRQEALRASCTRYLSWHGHRSPESMLAELHEVPGDLSGDRYGAGGVVAQLEAEVAELLDKPGAIFMPSGTMAQQIALRVHADRLGRQTVVMHPTAHPLMHEDEAPQRLHGLHLRGVGDPQQPLALAALREVAEPPAALLIELPQREIGGHLPTWAALNGQVGWARDRGAAVHLDGARLWEAQPFYQRSHAEIAALFDSVYVSFYKGLGGIAGACLVGEEDLIAQAGEWRHRHGGTLFAMWPLAASALAGLHLRLERMDAYVQHMQVIAAALRDLDGVDVVPDPPMTNMVHISLRTTAAALRARMVTLAARDGVWTWPSGYPTDRPGWQKVELTVGDATLAWDPHEVAALMAGLLESPPDGGAAHEPVEVVDVAGALVDVVPRAQIRAEGLRHRCTYIAVIDSDGLLVVHRRSQDKDVNPGMWDLAFGGLCDVGEGWEDGARRELAEEAGLEDVGLELLGEVAWEAEDAALLGRVYLARSDGPLSTPDGEVAELDRIPLSTLEGWLAAHDVCPDSAEVVTPLLAKVAIG